VISVVGIDPSSRKLAAVYGVVGREPYIEYTVEKLPQDKPTACLMAYEWMQRLVVGQQATGNTVYAAIELPVLGRGGPGSTIPQAQINGALLAGAQCAGATIILVNNARAKKEVVGKGNASKDDIRRWVKDAWPSLYSEIKNDQDLCDSAMIYQYGRKTVELRDRIARRKTIERATVLQRRRNARRKAAT
jgi:Holliday junction resolvasome RuvABC endonuclease subunit